jgi:enoyl reductase-like protein
MVVHMMPTTVKASFVSAVLQAGYHVKLVGSEHYPLAALHTKVMEIQEGMISPSIGLTLKSLYINNASSLSSSHFGRRCTIASGKWEFS